MRHARPTLLTLAAAFALCALVFAAGETVLAQCAMCKSSASGLDGAGAKNLNYAVVVLLCPPVAIFCALFVFAYRRRNPPDDRN